MKLDLTKVLNYYWKTLTDILRILVYDIFLETFNEKEKKTIDFFFHENDINFFFFLNSLLTNILKASINQTLCI